MTRGEDVPNTRGCSFHGSLPLAKGEGRGGGAGSGRCPANMPTIPPWPRPLLRLLLHFPGNCKARSLRTENTPTNPIERNPHEHFSHYRYWHRRGSPRPDGLESPRQMHAVTLSLRPAGSGTTGLFASARLAGLTVPRPRGRCCCALRRGSCQVTKTEQTVPLPRGAVGG